MADIFHGDIMPLIWVFPKHIHLHRSCIHVSRLGMSLGIHGFDKIYWNILISQGEKINRNIYHTIYPCKNLLKGIVSRGKHDIWGFVFGIKPPTKGKRFLYRRFRCVKRVYWSDGLCPTTGQIFKGGSYSKRYSNKKCFIIILYWGWIPDFQTKQCVRINYLFKISIIIFIGSRFHWVFFIIHISYSIYSLFCSFDNAFLRLIILCLPFSF